MDCTDLWVSTGEEWCPICRRDIFLTSYTPDDDNSVTDPMRDHQIGNLEHTYSYF
jgi:hypothetical protein